MELVEGEACAGDPSGGRTEGAHNPPQEEHTMSRESTEGGPKTTGGGRTNTFTDDREGHMPFLREASVDMLDQ